MVPNLQVWGPSNLVGTLGILGREHRRAGVADGLSALTQPPALLPNQVLRFEIQWQSNNEENGKPSPLFVGLVVF